MKILHVNEALDGSIDLVDLENKLKMYKDVQDRVKIGSFSATSNVTGIISDVDKITILLHKYGFLSFWDYATGGAYLDLNMNPFLKDQEYAIRKTSIIPKITLIYIYIYF